MTKKKGRKRRDEKYRLLRITIIPLPLILYWKRLSFPFKNKIATQSKKKNIYCFKKYLWDKSTMIDRFLSKIEKQ